MFGEKKVFFSNDKKSFTDAKQYCKDNGAKLFEPNGKKENADVSDAAESGGIKEFWIGINYDTDKFVLASNKDPIATKNVASYDDSKTFWANHHPNCTNCNNFCAESTSMKPYRWIDMKCTDTRAFVCQRSNYKQKLQFCKPYQTIIFLRHNLLIIDFLFQVKVKE